MIKETIPYFLTVYRNLGKGLHGLQKYFGKRFGVWEGSLLNLFEPTDFQSSGHFLSQNINRHKLQIVYTLKR